MNTCAIFEHIRRYRIAKNLDHIILVKKQNWLYSVRKTLNYMMQAAVQSQSHYIWCQNSL